MSAEVKGLNQLLNRLEKEYGQESFQKLTDKGLKKGAEAFVEKLKKEFEKFKDTGASIEEITTSNPMTINGKRTIKVYWKGPHDRYRIIHLNEFGTVKNPNPEGKGAIARALKASEKEYRETIKQVMKRG